MSLPEMQPQPLGCAMRGKDLTQAKACGYSKIAIFDGKIFIAYALSSGKNF
jgi:hypothetical protein